MIIKIDDWVFDVDLGTTMAYSAGEAEAHCTCGYCRNFYAAVDVSYPDLRPFLAGFGIDVEAPEELLPYEPTVMDGYYAVCGKVIQMGRNPMTVNGLSVTVVNTDEVHINVFCPEPYFVLNTGFLELPWVLDEAAEDVVSAANEPSFLEKISERLLNLLPKDSLKQ